MGSSVSFQTAVTEITNKVSNTLIQDVKADADAKCKVHIGSISFTKTNGCTISVKNLCSADAVGEVTAVVNAAVDFYNNLTVEQKQNVPQWFTASFGVTTTVNNVINDFSNYVKQKCLAKSVLENTIEINNITINDCNAPNGILTFEFINSGHATGQCAIHALTNILVSAANEITEKQSQGLDWSKLIWPISIGVVIVAVISLLFTYKDAFITSTKDKIDIIMAQNNSWPSKLKYAKEKLK